MRSTSTPSRCNVEKDSNPVHNLRNMWKNNSKHISPLSGPRNLGRPPVCWWNQFFSCIYNFLWSAADHGRRFVPPRMEGTGKVRRRVKSSNDRRDLLLRELWNKTTSVAKERPEEVDGGDTIQHKKIRPCVKQLSGQEANRSVVMHFIDHLVVDTEDKKCNRALSWSCDISHISIAKGKKT